MEYPKCHSPMKSNMSFYAKTQLIECLSNNEKPDNDYCFSDILQNEINKLNIKQNKIKERRCDNVS